MNSQGVGLGSMAPRRARSSSRRRPVRVPTASARSRAWRSPRPARAPAARARAAAAGPTRSPLRALDDRTKPDPQRRRTRACTHRCTKTAAAVVFLTQSKTTGKVARSSGARKVAVHHVVAGHHGIDGGAVLQRPTRPRVVLIGVVPRARGLRSGVLRLAARRRRLGGRGRVQREAAAPTTSSGSHILQVHGSTLARRRSALELERGRGRRRADGRSQAARAAPPACARTRSRVRPACTDPTRCGCGSCARTPRRSTFRCVEEDGVADQPHEATARAGRQRRRTRDGVLLRPGRRRLQCVLVCGWHCECVRSRVLVSQLPSGRGVGTVAAEFDFRLCRLVFRFGPVFGYATYLAFVRRRTHYLEPYSIGLRRFRGPIRRSSGSAGARAARRASAVPARPGTYSRPGRRGPGAGRCAYTELYDEWSH